VVSAGGTLPLDLGDDRPPGRVEVAVTIAVEASTAAGELTAVHAGAVGMALHLARGMDQAEARHTAAVRAEFSKELRTVLASLGLDRKSRGELTPAPPPAAVEVIEVDPFAAAGDTPTP
jgi:hypothetical protein